MKIRSLETFKITLPFRFAFGHALASRAKSSNLLVKVTLDNGICGFGESVPRDYVTGETVAQAEDNVLLKYAPLVLALEMDEAPAVLDYLRACFQNLGLDNKSQGASWCALELAVLDACCRLHGLRLCELIGPAKLKRVRYGGVIPFGRKKALTAILYFYKLYGFGTVKLKVGAANLDDDLEKLKLARKIMGEKCIIRVDANCAWSVDQALRAAEAFKTYNVSSYEQPLPANDWTGLKKLSEEIAEDVVVDESLCTLKQAKDLAAEKICDAFNVRVSKAGGVMAAQEMINIAQSHGMRLHLGAQVGESGILSAAARHLAVCNQEMENYEGSANFFLLKNDICREQLNAGLGGYADLSYGGKKHGLGLSIDERRILNLTDSSGEISDLPLSKTNSNISRQGASS